MSNILLSLLISVVFVVIKMVETKVYKKDIVLKTVARNAIIVFLSTMCVTYFQSKASGDVTVGTEAFVDKPNF